MADTEIVALGDEGDDEEQFHVYRPTAKGRYITVPPTIRKDRIRVTTA